MNIIAAITIGILLYFIIPGKNTEYIENKTINGHINTLQNNGFFKIRINSNFEIMNSILIVNHFPSINIRKRLRENPLTFIYYLRFDLDFDLYHVYPAVAAVNVNSVTGIVHVEQTFNCTSDIFTIFSKRSIFNF